MPKREEPNDEQLARFKAPSRLDAIQEAVEMFQDDCGAAAARYVPPRHRVQTEVVGIGT